MDDATGAGWWRRAPGWWAGGGALAQMLAAVVAFNLAGLACLVAIAVWVPLVVVPLVAMCWAVVLLLGAAARAAGEVEPHGGGVGDDGHWETWSVGGWPAPRPGGGVGPLERRRLMRELREWLDEPGSPG